MFIRVEPHKIQEFLKKGLKSNYMFVDLYPYELQELLRNGSANQMNFVNQLTNEEFETFIEYAEDEEFFYEYDIRDLLNDGDLWVEHYDPETVEDYDLYNACFDFENGKVIMLKCW